jgi:hypothetical protein
MGWIDNPMAAHPSEHTLHRQRPTNSVASCFLFRRSQTATQQPSGGEAAAPEQGDFAALCWLALIALHQLL